MRKLRNLYYNITNGIANLIFWIPTIWQDRDFSSHYIYKIYHKKIEKVIKHFESENCQPYVGMEKDIEKMKICKVLLGRLLDLQKDEFVNHLRFLYRYNNIAVDEYCNDDLHEHLLKNVGTSSLFVFKNINIPNNISKEKFLDIFNKCFKHEEYMVQQYLDLFTKYFAKHSKKWWD